MYDLEMLAEMGFCPGIENYSRHLTGRPPGQPPPTLLDYFPRRLPAVRRREPRHRPADRRDVPRRPLAQADAGRVRLPPALGARQPAAQLRGVGGAASRQVVYVSATPGDYELRKSGGAGGRAADPPHRPDRSRDRGAQGRHPGRRSARRDPQARRGRRARAGHHADQEDGRGPDRLLSRPRRARALPALRHRDPRARRDHPRACARATSTCWSASTCCARGSTCPRSRWSRSSTPTRKASCARRAR